MTMKTPRPILVYVIASLLSALLSTLGMMLLPDDSIILKIFPGLILATVLWFLHRQDYAGPAYLQWAAWLVLAIATTVGWRLSIEVGASLDNPIPYTSAGAVGSGITLLALAVVWRVGRCTPLFLIIGILAGSLGGLVFGVVDMFVRQSQEFLWTLLLFSVWQMVFLAGLWVGLTVCARRQAP